MARINIVRHTLWMICIFAGISACDRPEQTGVQESEGHARAPVEQPASDAPVNLLEFDAAGMRFSGGNTIRSGWTTLRMNNRDNMLHFGMVVRLPEFQM